MSYCRVFILWRIIFPRHQWFHHVQFYFSSQAAELPFYFHLTGEFQNWMNNLKKKLWTFCCIDFVRRKVWNHDFNVLGKFFTWNHTIHWIWNKWFLNNWGRENFFRFVSSFCRFECDSWSGGWLREHQIISFNQHHKWNS